MLSQLSDENQDRKKKNEEKENGLILTIVISWDTQQNQSTHKNNLMDRYLDWMHLNKECSDEQLWM